MAENDRARFRAPSGFRSIPASEVFSPREDYVPAPRLASSQPLPPELPNASGMRLQATRQPGENVGPFGPGISTTAGVFPADIRERSGQSILVPEPAPLQPQRTFTLGPRFGAVARDDGFIEVTDIVRDPSRGRVFTNLVAPGATQEALSAIAEPGTPPGGFVQSDAGRLSATATPAGESPELQRLGFMGRPAAGTGTVAAEPPSIDATVSQAPTTFTPAAEGQGFRREARRNAAGEIVAPAAEISGTELNRLGARLAEGAVERRQEPRSVQEVLEQEFPGLENSALALRRARVIAQNEQNLANRAENLGLRNRTEARAERELDRQEAQLEINQQQADAQTATALTAARRAAQELGTEFEGVFEERPIDPTNPLLGTTRTLTGFQTKGKGTGLPAFIPLEDLNAYREALRLNAGDEQAINAINNEFRATYLAQAQ